MDKKTIKTIQMAYSQGRSAQEISQELGLSWKKVIYWMNKYGIKRRNRSEATYLKRNPTEPFKIKRGLTEDEQQLKTLAVGLYLGEGSKRQKNSVRLSNSDPTIISIFIQFLRVICGVPEEKIKISLLLHPDIKTRETERFWSNHLNIPLGQFTKTTILKRRGNGTYKNRSLYGVATVYVHNLKLRNILQNWVEEHTCKFS